MPDRVHCKDESPSPTVTPTGVATTLRQVVHQLSQLEPATARYLAGLAFVLMRVADADNEIDPAETRRIESILNQHVAVPEEQAVLVAEVARHRQQWTDCADAYQVSKQLRGTAPRHQRQALLHSLFAVALADGTISAREKQVIHQIAVELGFCSSDVTATHEQVLGNCLH